ncbi:TonB-dependent receptor [Sphingobium estronivorans]|uniref:TonB-dependent receptor n=1 Tax=Sphingobium estronivorans TaxID=1577690 RepID=UPI00123ABE79|nr:TonB-dependent receptor [Sphingobium estronivorans]
MIHPWEDDMQGKFGTMKLYAQLGVCGLIALPFPVIAQNAIAPGASVENNRDSGLADIVVIGRKRARAEEIQKVPTAITAVSAAQLQSPALKSLVEIGTLAPNASLQPSVQRGVQNFAIRGMGVSGTTVSDEPAVGIFQDGVYWGSNYGAIGDTFDLEGVEILRGPQGTLFGRNVTGGAVTIRSARPTEDRSARMSVGVGNGMMFEGSAVANGPLADGVAGRIAAMVRRNDGLFTNVTDGSSYGKSTSFIVRPSIKLTPSENFDVTLLGEYFGLRGDPTVTRGISPTTIPGAPPTAAQQAGYVSPSDFWATNPGERGFNHVDVYFGMLEANLHIGPGTLTSISGYRRVRTNNDFDSDGFPPVSFRQLAANRQHQWSTELRYAADYAPWLSGTTGFYYFDQSVDYTEARVLSGGATRVAAAALLDNSSYAFFSEFDIKPTDFVTVTVGGRYSHEKKDAQSAAFGACAFDFSTCNYTVPPKPYKGNNFSPKIGISVQPTDNVMLFGSFTKGFRSGGFSLRGTPLGAPYQAETVKAWEAGLKSDLLDRHLRINVTGFINTFSNLQRTVLGTDPVLGVVQSVFNAADAKIKGVELEVTAIPVRGLTLSGSYGYTDAKYDRFDTFPNFANLQFVRVPKHTGQVSMDYDSEFANGGRINLHAGVAYTGHYFFNDANTPTIDQKGYALADASVTFTTSDKLSITVYSRNLLNKKYAYWGSTLGALGQNIFPGDPRTYGVRLSAAF